MEQRLGSPVYFKNAPPFGRAMRRLHEQTERARDFYNNIMDEFDQDITSSVKKYATEEVLAELWQNKINGKRDPRISVDDGEEDETFRETKGKVADMKRDLSNALLLALHSTIRHGREESVRNKARRDTAKRLLRKVETANALILDLLGQVRGGREHCVALVSELDELKALIDPDNHKDIYKTEADDVDDNAPSAGNDEYDD